MSPHLKKQGSPTSESTIQDDKVETLIQTLLMEIVPARETSGGARVEKNPNVGMPSQV